MAPTTNEVQGISPYIGTDMVMVGNGSNLPISETTNFTLLNTSMQLKKNTLIVPTLRKKLLLVSKFTTDNQCCFLFYPWGFFIKDLQTNQVMLKGPMHDGLYPLTSSIQRINPMAFLTNKVLGNIWHTRFRHPTLELFILCFHVFLLQINEWIFVKVVLWESSKLPFQNRSSHVLIFLHTNVWGPAPTPSFDGYRYYLV